MGQPVSIRPNGMKDNDLGRRDREIENFPPGRSGMQRACRRLQALVVEGSPRAAGRPGPYNQSALTVMVGQLPEHLAVENDAQLVRGLVAVPGFRNVQPEVAGVEREQG